ncbi:hypothetical protein BASA60_009312 [Batrachochytrium salamandrivorans]|nr:hypothetical protein BASA60_009312 [Batrachochytrium salamandrivorans]
MVTPTNQADIQLPVAYPEEGYSEPPENEPNHDTHSTGHAMVSVSTKLSSGHNYGLWALFFLFGIAMLIPWNTWTTAAPFFSERLKGSPFANNFQSWIGLTFMLTNLGSLCALLPFQDRIDPVKRITAGLVLCGIVFFVAVGMLSLTTMNPSTYFICNLILVVLSSIASALVAGMMAFATEFTPLIVTALVSGQGMSGIVPTVVQIVLTVSSSGSSDSPSSGSSHTVAVTKACFFISICISVVSLIGYTILRKSSYAPRRTIRFNIPEHANSSSDGIAEESSSDSLLAGLSPEADRSESFADHWKIWKAVSPSVISMVLNFSVTLALFPTLTSYIQTTQIDATQSSLSTVGDKNQKNLLSYFIFWCLISLISLENVFLWCLVFPGFHNEPSFMRRFLG